DLAVAIGSGADADGGNVDGGGEFLRDGWRDQFEDDGEGAGVGESLSIFDESKVFCFDFAFYFVAAFFADALRKHAEMAHEGNAGDGDRLYLRENFASAFGFDTVRAGGDEALGVAEGGGGIFVAAVGQVGDQEGTGFGAGGGAKMML